MPNKIGVLVAIATLTLTQAVGFAQDSSTHVSAELNNQNFPEASSSYILTAEKTANSINVKK